MPSEAGSKARPSSSTSLSPVEGELIHFFVQLAASLSIPKSIGEIFGLLFCAEEPLPFEAIVSRLGLSKGSASQGLRFLQKISAVSTVYVQRDRRTFYEAQTSIRKLVTGVLNESLRPHLESNEDHLERINQLIKDENTPDSSVISERVGSLITWNQKAKSLLPWLVRITSPRPRNDKSNP